MRKNIKTEIFVRILSGLIVASMLIPLFVACRKGDETDGTDETESMGTTQEGTEKIEVPQDFQLKTAAGFVLDGNVLSMNYTHEYPILDLSERISVKTGGKWCITNSDGTKDTDAKALSLSEGENSFFITEVRVVIGVKGITIDPYAVKEIIYSMLGVECEIIYGDL